MSVHVKTTYGALEIGDYIVGRADIWKVTHKREDGWLGILNGAGERKKLPPELGDKSVVQVHYGFNSLEEMQAAAEQAVKDTLGGTVLHRTEGPKWVMPSLAEIYNDAIQLKAHLAVHHDATMCGPEATLADLKEVHDFAHTLSNDHTHEEN